MVSHVSGLSIRRFLNTSGDYAVGMLLALLITLVIQGTPAKEQDTHGERQHKAEHVEHKGGVKEHGPTPIPPSAMARSPA